MLIPPVTGFILGWFPWFPNPPHMEDAPRFSVALIFAMAGLCSIFVVKLVKKIAEAWGIDIDMDETPKEQKCKR
jgi:hypothetical protein